MTNMYFVNLLLVSIASLSLSNVKSFRNSNCFPINRIIEIRLKAEFGFLESPGENPISTNFIPANIFNADDIEPDSFKGFLKEQFLEIQENNDPKGTISFQDYFSWKSKLGLFFSEDEVRDLWEHTCGDREATCNLQNFIQLTIMIDEQ